jgi:hypothetical protein
LNSLQPITTKVKIKIWTSYNALIDLDLNIWGKICNNAKELLDELTRLGLTKEEIDAFKQKLSAESKELFIECLRLNKKSLLERFDKLTVNLYAFNANVVEDPMFRVNTDYMTETKASIGEIEVIVIDSKEGADKKILEAAKEFREHPELNALCFCARQISARKYIKNIRDNEIIKLTPIDGEKTVAAIKNKDYGINDTKKNTTITYVRGTEHAGRNYKDENLLIVNAAFQIPLVERLTVDPMTDEIKVKPLQLARWELLKQVLGRIQRGDAARKWIVITGDPEEVKDFFSWAYDAEFRIPFTFKFTISFTYAGIGFGLSIRTLNLHVWLQLTNMKKLGCLSLTLIMNLV